MALVLALLLPSCVILTEEDWSAEANERECRGIPGQTDLRLVEAGTWSVGSAEAEVGRDIDEARHEVDLLAYEIAGVETTRAEFAACMGYDPGHAQGCGDRCPVESVTWHEAARYTNVLSGNEGLARCYDCDGEGVDITCTTRAAAPQRCRGYRLPEHDEWEVAARAGSRDAFSGAGGLEPGDEDLCTAVTLDRSVELGDIAWFCGNAGGTPHPVGGLLPNGAGLFDTSGNVWEWVEVFSGEGDEDYGNGMRMVRGGGYASTPADLRNANLTMVDGGAVFVDVGFRIARTAFDDTGG